jgi:membrane protease subunit HflC
MMRKIILLVCLGLLVLYLVGTSFVTVDPTVYVYVTQFGRHEVTYDGGDNDQDAGLHLRLPSPIQSVQRLDRRLQVFDLPGVELLTRDRAKNTIDKTLTIDAYVCWRIAGKEGVDRFIRKVGTADRARTILGHRINGQLAAAIGRKSMDDLVSVRPGQVKKTMTTIRKTLLESQRKQALAEYGIRIIDIRLRRFNFPPKVQETIFERIKSERATKAAEYRRQGTTQAAAIRNKAKKEARILVANARAKAERLRGDALAEADRIRNAAHLRQREFYKFLKKLEDYARILGDSKTVLYLSTRREVFDLLLNPATAGASPKQVAGPRPPRKKGK